MIYVVIIDDILCNARTAIERMDFGEREELIAKRMEKTE